MQSPERDRTVSEAEAKPAQPFVTFGRTVCVVAPIRCRARGVLDAPVASVECVMCARAARRSARARAIVSLGTPFTDRFASAITCRPSEFRSRAFGCAACEPRDTDSATK